MRLLLLLQLLFRRWLVALPLVIVGLWVAR
jgi:hypothetical protein